MDDFWDYVRACWDWCGRMVVRIMFVCACLWTLRCFLLGRLIGKAEFAHFLNGLVNYILD
jgi:hypothetical protein